MRKIFYFKQQTSYDVIRYIQKTEGLHVNNQSIMRIILKFEEFSVHFLTIY